MMRETDSLEPMWERRSDAGRAEKFVVGTAGLAAGLLRVTLPRLFSYTSGQQPAFHLAWGAREYRIGRDGLESRRRSEKGWEDNPRSNYNEAIAKKQQRKAGGNKSRSADETPEP